MKRFNNIFEWFYAEADYSFSPVGYVRYDK